MKMHLDNRELFPLAAAAATGHTHLAGKIRSSEVTDLSIAPYATDRDLLINWLIPVSVL